MEKNQDMAFADTVDALEMTPDIIVDQLEATALEYYQAGRLDRARDYLDKLVMMRPKRANYWALLGVVFRRQNRRAAALTALKKAAEIDGEDRNVLVNLGETLLEVGKVEAGTELLRAVFEEGYEPQKAPAEQDEFTIRAGADLEFVQRAIRGFVEAEGKG